MKTNVFITLIIFILKEVKPLNFLEFIEKSIIKRYLENNIQQTSENTPSSQILNICQDFQQAEVMAEVLRQSRHL